MTIGAWVFFIVIVVCGLVAAFLAGSYFWAEGIHRAAVFFGVLIVLFTAMISGLFFWYRTNSASGQRALKDQKSNLNGGIERTVTVYDVDGDVIAEYTGKFDIETDRESYILFDDEFGKRHICFAGANKGRCGQPPEPRLRR